MFIDGHKLPLSFDKWLKKAQQGFDDYTRKGHTVEKVYIDPDTFPAWCRERGHEIDARARTEFANDVVGRKYVYRD